ncbi:hypothetical protein B0H14DRAFT_2659817, partial [Mycena olivaceomarginata]
MATHITTILIPNSPTMSSASSFEAVSSRSRSSTASSGVDFDDSDDEIVWGQSSDGSLDSDIASDDDFVVLSRPGSPRVSATGAQPTNGVETPSNLASDVGRLSLNEASTITRKEKTAKQDTKPAAKAAPSPSKTPRPVSGPPSSSRASPVLERASSVATLKEAGRRRRINASRSATQSPTPGSPLSGGVRLSPRRGRKSRNTSPTPVSPLSPVHVGLGARPIVDDVSECASECGTAVEEPVLGAYDAAATYINSCISDPTSACRLSLLQALLIELGFASSSLPMSLTQAKALLKSRAFVNIGEYLDARKEGPAAVQGIIHPSKSSLKRNLRRSRNRVPLQWVKEIGLGALLVR